MQVQVDATQSQLSENPQAPPEEVPPTDPSLATTDPSQLIQSYQPPDSSPETAPRLNVHREVGAILTGKVKRYSIKNGFGFIACHDGGEDCFVHQSEIQADGFRCLQEGAEVQFEFSYHHDRPNATKVCGPDGAPLTTYKSRMEAISAECKQVGGKTGKVKWFNQAKGFGFIIPDDGSSVDVFFDAKQIHGSQMLTEGMHVRYDDMVSEKDARHTAMNVCINEQSYFPNLTAAEGTEKGILKSWDEPRGFGFIQPDAGGPELYVGRSVVDVHTQSIIKDDLPVTYDTAGQGEKVWATNVRAAGQIPLSAPVVPSPPASSTLKHRTGPLQNPKEVHRNLGDILTGVVKRYSIKNGFGFVECDDGGEDCFIHQSEIQTEGFRCVDEGEQIQFTYALHENKPSASKVTGRDGKPLKSYKSRLEAVTAGTKVAARSKGGRIKWISPEKGFGFIISNDGTPGDVFFDIKDFVGAPLPKENDPVIYDEVASEDGRRTALRVTPHNIPFPVYQGVNPNEKMGTVKFYNLAKGFGFIIPVDSPGTEIYVGKSSLDGDISAMLHEGVAVTYELQGKDDKVWAVNVQIPGKSNNKRAREWDASAAQGAYQDPKRRGFFDDVLAPFTPTPGYPQQFTPGRVDSKGAQMQYPQQQIPSGYGYPSYPSPYYGQPAAYPAYNPAVYGQTASAATARWPAQGEYDYAAAASYDPNAYAAAYAAQQQAQAAAAAAQPPQTPLQLQQQQLQQQQLQQQQLQQQQLQQLQQQQLQPQSSPTPTYRPNAASPYAPY